MGDFWARWRVAILLVGGVSLVILVSILAFGGASPRIAPKSDPLVVATAAHATIATPGSVTPAPESAAPSAAPLAAATTASPWKKAEPIPGAKATWDTNFGDPFESDAGNPGDVRTLVTVGAFRLGVTHA